MRIEFPDLKDKEEKTLFIIGNGFDLHHAILSKYTHFCCWLRLNGYEDFVERMEIIFDNLQTTDRVHYLWYDFEASLGAYDPNSMYKRLHVPTNEMFDPEKWQKIAHEEVGKTTERIRPLMAKWAKQINIKSVVPDLELSIKSRYLTFNYTKVLEEAYGIPAMQICHIHGSVDDDEVIVGHRTFSKPDSLTQDSDEAEIIQREYIKALNLLNKKAEDQTKKHDAFFSGLKDITRVVVLGHSLNEIDLSYIGEVAKIVPESAHWHISKHTEQDDERIRAFEKWYREDGPKREMNRWIFNF